MASRKGLVEYFGSSGGHKCGYCKGQKPGEADNGKFRNGMWGHFLSAQNYQDLMDRGWRRSGRYCYKPIMNKTCCPTYTIKCDALQIKPSRSQKKVIKQVNTFLLNGTKPVVKTSLGAGSSSFEMIQHSEPVAKFDECPKLTSSSEVDHGDRCESEPMLGTSSTEHCPIDVEHPRKRIREVGIDIPIQKKAKQKRIEKKINRIMKKSNCSYEVAFTLMKEERKVHLERLKPKTLEELLFPSMSKKPAHTLQIRFKCTCDNEYAETFQLSHEVYQKYQMAIHGDTLEECTRKGFKRFLVDSPLILEEFTSSKNSQIPCKFGSYHMQYWLDDERLIAIGVLDILPSSVSSVYLLYDPEFSFLSLGTYSALRELALVRQLQAIRSELKFYYMGYYIHSCPKMRYKGGYFPSYLLCPEVFTWQPVESCVAKLDESKYSRLDEDTNKIDEDVESLTDNDIMIFYNQSCLTYPVYKTVVGEDEQEVQSYARLLGKKCTRSLLLYRSEK
ncbi:Arginyl-tRNA--protein transferase 1 [Halotydeus destructor]|nr:Arginyl-tRNA--protein transferase 1 [Halotydeus destructor]